MPKIPNEPETNIPKSGLSRAGVVGATAARVAFNQIGHKIKRPFLSDSQKTLSKEDLDNENAKLIFDALSKLRGTAMKLGQLLGMEMDIIPPAYQKELEKSFYRVPPLNRTLVRKVFINEFNKPPEEIFAEFDGNAFAAASLGQVHHATLKNGDKVAVKVQYPGVGDAMRSDLKMMRQIGATLPQTSSFSPALLEIEKRLTEELDYNSEAKNTNWFRESNRLGFVKIPYVYDEFSTGKILTTSIINGDHLNTWLDKNPSQELRNKTAQNLYDFFVESVRNTMRLHADPNPGNFLLGDDGNIGVIDFGCIKNLKPEFANLFPDLLKMQLAGKKEDIIAAYVALGVPAENINDDLYENFIKPFGDWSVMPIKKPEYNFATEFHSKTGAEFMRQLPRQTAFVNIAEDFALFNRTIYGLCKIFERMDAEIECQNRWLD